MRLTRFEPAILVSERPQIHTYDRAVTEIAYDNISRYYSDNFFGCVL